MTIKSLEKCPISLIIREMQMSTPRKQITKNSSKDVEKEEHILVTVGNVKLSSHCGNSKRYKQNYQMAQLSYCAVHTESTF